MTYLSTDRKADAESDLAYYIALIAFLDTAITSGRDPAAKRIDFDSGTGRESISFHSIQEMFDQRARAEASRDRLRRLLGNQSVIRQQTRR